jgi:hypothetical protein
VALLEINPDLRRLTTAAERIAWALEQLVLHQYGVQPAPPKRMWPSAPASDEDIAYATNESTLRQELEQLVRPGDVAERDGSDVEEEVGSDVLNQDRRT